MRPIVPSPLPIDSQLGTIVGTLQEHGTLVLEAEPGSGKTTRVAPALLDHDARRRIFVLEPRRIAARAAARRVSHERAGKLGQEIGYVVRHDRRISAATRIRYVTDGVLLRRILADPFLEGITTVVLDEFHERHVESELALGMLREIRRTVRPDLEILVMSATLDADPIVAWLDAAHVRVAGRSHDVSIHWFEQHDPRPLELRMFDATRRALKETRGHVLAFLPGKREIEATMRALRGAPECANVEILPLHGSLDSEAQDAAVRPTTRRKVVVATNLAESSLTIEGVSAVVDGGLVRLHRHDAGRGLDRLVLEEASLASLTQRAGRAGRTEDGRCYRVWTQGEERRRAAQTTPELLRIDLAGPALAVRSFAGLDPSRFAWLTPPDPHALARAEALLVDLGAVDQGGRITETGAAMLRLPLHPRLARIVVAAETLGCRFEAAGIAALLSEGAFRNLPCGEAGALIEQLWTLRELREHGLGAGICQRLGVDRAHARRVATAQDQIAGGARPCDELPDRDLAHAVLLGFPDRVAVSRQDTPRKASLLGHRSLEIRKGTLPEDRPQDRWFVALDLVDRSQRGRARPMVSLAQPIECAWLRELGSDAIRTTDEPTLDAERGQVRIVRRTRYADLLIDETPAGSASREVAAPLLLRLLERNPERWLPQLQSFARLRQRIAWLRAATTDDQVRDTLPRLDNAELASLALEASDGRDLASLRRADLAPWLFARWPTLRATLDRDAPDSVQLPSGRKAKIHYDREGGPTVAARLQEFFGSTATPRLAGGRVQVVLELLAPNLRPVQVTTDLASFWTNLYPRVRSELRRRYPKHAWPADPTTAKPQRH